MESYWPGVLTHLAVFVWGMGLAWGILRWRERKEYEERIAELARWRVKISHAPGGHGSTVMSCQAGRRILTKQDQL